MRTKADCNEDLDDYNKRIREYSEGLGRLLSGVKHIIVRTQADYSEDLARL